MRCVLQQLEEWTQFVFLSLMELVWTQCMASFDAYVHLLVGYEVQADLFCPGKWLVAQMLWSSLDHLQEEGHVV